MGTDYVASTDSAGLDVSLTKQALAGIEDGRMLEQFICSVSGISL